MTKTKIPTGFRVLLVDETVPFDTEVHRAPVTGLGSEDPMTLVPYGVVVGRRHAGDRYIQVRTPTRGDRTTPRYDLYVRTNETVLVAHQGYTGDVPASQWLPAEVDAETEASLRVLLKDHAVVSLQPLADIVTHYALVPPHPDDDLGGIALTSLDTAGYLLVPNRDTLRSRLLQEFEILLSEAGAHLPEDVLDVVLDAIGYTEPEPEVEPVALRSYD